MVWPDASSWLQPGAGLTAALGANTTVLCDAVLVDLGVNREGEPRSPLVTAKPSPAQIVSASSGFLIRARGVVLRFYLQPRGFREDGVRRPLLPRVISGSLDWFPRRSDAALLGSTLPVAVGAPLWDRPLVVVGWRRPASEQSEQTMVLPCS